MESAGCQLLANFQIGRAVVLTMARHDSAVCRQISAHRAICSSSGNRSHSSAHRSQASAQVAQTAETNATDACSLQCPIIDVVVPGPGAELGAPT